MDGHNATLGLVIFIIAVALVFDYTNGFHDAANSIATVVATRVLVVLGQELVPTRVRRRRSPTPVLADDGEERPLVRLPNSDDLDNDTAED